MGAPIASRFAQIGHSFSYIQPNWDTHYGTKITGVGATAFNKGELTTFVGQPPVQVAAATSHAKVKGLEYTRQRTISLVDLSDESFSVVAIERVLGGAEHTFSFHGPDGEATPLGVEPQLYEGTALGEGLKYGDFSSAKDGDLSCLAFMRDPARATPEGVWSLDYLLRDQGDLHLRMTAVYPEGGELILAKGKAPGGKSAYDMTWAILKSRGEAPLTRQYVNVLEPYAGEPAIRSVERLEVAGSVADSPFGPLAIRVITSEFVDTLVFQHQHGSALAVDGIEFDGEVGLWRERNGKLHTATLVRGTKLQRDGKGITLEAAEYKGTVVACDWKSNAITIEPAPAGVASLSGRHVRISNAHGSSASYQINAAEAVGNGCRLTFRLDPRIGEGFVQDCRDGVVVSKIHLRLYPFGYYAGKTLANETGEVWHKLTEVPKGRDCLLVPDDSKDLSAANLKAQFSDFDGDGLPRFAIYDYGPGDLVRMENVATVSGP